MAISPEVGAAGILAGGSLIQGLMGQKARAEEERKKRAFETLSSQAQAQIEAEKQLARGQQQALGGLLGSFKSGLIF